MLRWCPAGCQPSVMLLSLLTAAVSPRLWSWAPVQVGAVLGKGGSHIAQIRTMTGARVQLQGVSKAALPSSCTLTLRLASVLT